MRYFLFTAAIAALTCLNVVAYAQDDVVANIIELGKTNNTVMQLEDTLANRIGGRIVGSDALLHAEKWVAKLLRSWGYEVMVQEVGQMKVGFERGPWFGRMLSEDGMILHFATPSYTAGTKGPQMGRVVIEPETLAEFEKMKGQIKGAWVLIGGESDGSPIDWSSEADAKRAELIEEQAKAMEKSEKKPWKKPKSVPALLYRQMVEAGALGFIQKSDVPIKALSDRKNKDNITIHNLPNVCDIKLDSKQYDIIYEKARRREEFFMEFDIRNHFFEGPVPYSNIIAIMRGSEYPNEYVITGGHLDAYDVASGAVDDAHGTCVNLETARLLAMAGAKPKRSIIIAIWTAEEYGLLGSKYFVENNTVPLNSISNYFNRDGGPLCPASVTVKPAMYNDWLEAAKGINEINPKFPFEVRKDESGPTKRPERAGGSDHAYFVKNGVPAVSITLGDPNGYNFSYGEIWHSERDNFNRIYQEYMEHSTIVNAVLVYRLANLDHILSREGLYSK